MKRLLLVIMVCSVGVLAFAADDPNRNETIVLQRVQGDVSIRHGVTEVWTKAAAGDALKPDDTIKTGKKGSAVLVAQLVREESTTGKRITLPAEVIVDMSDIRDLSQEELMLKLTMEKVRASSYQWKNDELHIPNATVVHGAERGQSVALTENDLQIGRFQLNGTRVLYDNGFYSTCALKAMEVLRHYPALAEKVDNRLLVAQALEKANLRGEALSEYGAISKMEQLTSEEESLIQSRINQLRK